MTDSESDSFGSAISHRMLVESDHHLRVTKRDQTRTIPREWACRGCNERFDSIPDERCPEPTVWVKLGCPGDGVGHCRECDAFFVFERPVNPFYEHGCPACGSIKWVRTDKTADEVDVSRVMRDA